MLPRQRCYVDAVVSAGSVSEAQHAASAGHAAKGGQLILDTLHHHGAGVKAHSVSAVQTAERRFRVGRHRLGLVDAGSVATTPG